MLLSPLSTGQWCIHNYAWAAGVDPSRCVSHLKYNYNSLLAKIGEILSAIQRIYLYLICLTLSFPTINVLFHEFRQNQERLNFLCFRTLPKNNPRVRIVFLRLKLSKRKVLTTSPLLGTKRSPPLSNPDGQEPTWCWIVAETFFFPLFFCIFTRFESTAYGFGSTWTGYILQIIKLTNRFLFTSKGFSCNDLDVSTSWLP